MATNDEITICWIALTDPQFVYRVNGWMTSEALAEIDALLAEDPLEVSGLSGETGGILCRVWQEEDGHGFGSYWIVEPIEPLRIELMRGVNSEQATAKR